jgi:SAM-dependent methyltransferase
VTTCDRAETVRRAAITAVTSADWPGYIEQFHGERAGITNSILERCHSDGETPYEWLGRSLPAPGAIVLDLACGNAPMEPIVRPGWIGVDRSEAELRAAGPRVPAGRSCRADATALPLREGSVDAAVCCMGLMVISSPVHALQEVVRITRERAPISVLVPARGPLTVRDRTRYARLLVALRRTAFAYPSPAAVNDPVGLLRDAGLFVVSDISRRFALDLAGDTVADLLVDSLYLPGTTPGRTDAAKRVTRRFNRADLGIPLRRLVAR